MSTGQKTANKHKCKKNDENFKEVKKGKKWGKWGKCKSAKFKFGMSAEKCTV